MAAVRVRMAPSPTGPIHVGNVHTALFNWFFARSQGGKFILRFEDTDRERSRPEWEDVIYQELKWLGIDWDEGPDIGGPFGPYRQMERLHLYEKYARQLFDTGHAYYCYCKPEELEAERAEAQKNRIAYKYSRKCRCLTAEQRAELEAQRRKPVIRFKVPDGQMVVFHDLIRGDIETPSDSIGDFIIVRSNGIPIYNFTVVIDDVTMEITHIIRGEGHISNTPVQILLYEALGLPKPVIAHVGHLVGADRHKLSKRKGEAFVGDYREQGYLHDALMNFMALLGWSPEGDREFLTVEEMVREFDIRRITKTAAVFDHDKLDWMNGNYIRQKSLEEITRLTLPFLQRAGLVEGTPEGTEWERLKGIIASIHERMVTLAEAPSLTEFFFKDEIQYEEDAVKKIITPDAIPILATLRNRLAEVDSFVPEAVETVVRGLVEELGAKTKAVFHPLRVAVTGRAVSPGLFESVALIGRERVLARLDRVVEGRIQEG